MFRLIIYGLFIFILLPQGLLAADQASIRMGEHNDYSRLVFDLGSRVPYSVKTPSSGKLVVEFQKEMELAQVPEDGRSLRNIAGFEVLSRSPLSVTVDIPEDSKFRQFFAGNRLVLDVYNSPSGVTKSSQSSQSEPKKTASVKEKPLKAKPPVEKEEAITEPKTASASASEPSVPEPDEDQLEAPEQPEETLKKSRKPVKPNLITVSSTKSMGLAVFELNDEIWIVNDKEDLLLTPQVSGPQAKHFLPLKSEGVPGGKVFRMPALEGAEVRGQGGGLLWRVVVSPEKKNRKPVSPVRKDVEEGVFRSGKIVWPFEGASEIINLSDPVSGTAIKAVTVKSSKQFSGPAASFVDFDILSSPVGLVIVPKVDDLEVKVTGEGVEISRIGGLAVSSAEKAKVASAKKTLPKRSDKKKVAWKRIYDFQNWRLGGVGSLEQNTNIVLSELHELPEEEQIESLVSLAKMYLANAHGAESLGFLEFAERELPDLADNPQFVALRGAAKALDWKTEAAFRDLSIDELEEFEEIGYWRAYILADLGDWQQAEEVLPEHFDVLEGYPALIFNRLAIVLAEVALRAGNVESGDRLLEGLESRGGQLLPPQKAALEYLKGEAARQRGDVAETKKLWEVLAKDQDDLYRTKANLALARLRVNEKEISPAKAIDSLERLRYAWRGDQLEAQIYYWLGKTYFESSEYVKGLNIMREAASFASGTSLGPRITAEMSEVFTALFLSEDLDKVTPLDATALYEQFSELSPADERGDQVVEKLAEHLVEADLLGRAAKLLAHQIEHRLDDADGYRVGVRLAAIQLLDKKPSGALKSLDQALAKLKTLPEEMQTSERLLEISLLRAHGLSEQGRPDQALALLKDLERGPDVNRLRADIAWNASYWDDAAEALEDVILDRNISLTRPLGGLDTTLLLHRAVALNLGSDRIALANMREKYSDAMAQTDKARVFEVITRPRQSAALADRETLMGVVSEVDLFGDFLDSYRSAQTASN